MTESANKLPVVWRINIKPESAKGVDPRKFCIDNNIIGVGWGINTTEKLDWDRYRELAKDQYKDKKFIKSWTAALNAIKHRIQENDLCWTRDINGIYYLARITGPWKYLADQDNCRTDIYNIRPCEYFRVGTVDAVPGKVVNSFGLGRTVQQVDGAAIQKYSAYVYNTLSRSDLYQISYGSTDIFSLISSEDCEDIISLYLQLNGYILIPSSCKKSTAAYEWVMRHKDNGRRCVAQVKNGYVDLDIKDYLHYEGQVFLFTTKGKYLGPSVDNVICLEPDFIKNFIIENESILPERIKYWIQYARSTSE